MARFVPSEPYSTGFFGYITPYSAPETRKFIHGDGTMYEATRQQPTTVTAQNANAPSPFQVTSYRMAPQNAGISLRESLEQPETQAYASAELPYADLYHTTLGYVPSNY